MQKVLGTETCVGETDRRDRSPCSCALPSCVYRLPVLLYISTVLHMASVLPRHVSSTTVASRPDAEISVEADARNELLVYVLSVAHTYKTEGDETPRRLGKDELSHDNASRRFRNTQGITAPGTIICGYRAHGPESPIVRNFSISKAFQFFSFSGESSTASAPSFTSDACSTKRFLLHRRA